MKKHANPTIRPVYVFKLSGKVIDQPELLAKLCFQLVRLQDSGADVVVVHGGGKQIDTQTAALGIPKRTVNGLRYTDSRTLQVVESVAATLNRFIVKAIQTAGGSAQGLNVGHSFAVWASPQAELGLVGTVTRVNHTLIHHTLKRGQIPVLSNLALGINTCLNVNADDMALAVATSLNATRLVFLSDVPGILTDPQNHATLQPRLTVRQARHLITTGVIRDGMVPKINACLNALNARVNTVQILGATDALHPHKGILHANSGTLMTK